MNIQDMVRSVSGRLRDEAFFADIPVLEEDKGDVSAELSAKVSRRRLAVMVGWDGFTSRGDSSSVIFGEAVVVVSIFEQPTVNRRAEGSKTLLAVAREVANSLHLFTLPGDSSPLVFTNITPVQSLTGGEQGVITADVRFKTEIDL